MNIQSNEIRALSNDECDSVSGGWVHLVVLASPFVAAAGMRLGCYLGQPKAEAPIIDLPPSPEFPE